MGTDALEECMHHSDNIWILRVLHHLNVNFVEQDEVAFTWKIVQSEMFIEMGYAFRLSIYKKKTRSYK